jgi:hypothetical protein
MPQEADVGKRKAGYGQLVVFLLAARTRMNLDAEFAQFWTTYPRKRNKIDARKAFEQARRGGVTLDTMLTALAWQRGQSQWVRDGGQYIPFPASWIRAGSYDDEPDEPVQPVRAEYWADVCQREHGSACRNRWDHEMKLREQAS